MEKKLSGLVQVYTGEGKGKTQSAYGLAMRASGHGLRVLIVQFVKAEDVETGEVISARKLGPNVQVVGFGGSDVWGEGTPKPEYGNEAKVHAQAAFTYARRQVLESRFDVVILEEINVAMMLGLIDRARVVGLINERPEEVELVLTGQGAPPEVVELADLVTEMRNVKHPYARGIHARKGIDY